MKLVTRQRGERGASLVEFAIVLPIFALLLFGMIDFGFAFGDYLSIRSGVREGARRAAVNELPATIACRLGNSDVAPTGTSAAANAQRLACLTKKRIGLNEDRVRVSIFVPPGANTGDQVSICADVLLDSKSGLTRPFLTNRRARSSTDIRMESAPTFASYNEANGGSVTCP